VHVYNSKIGPLVCDAISGLRTSSARRYFYSLVSGSAFHQQSPFGTDGSHNQSLPQDRDTILDPSRESSIPAMIMLHLFALLPARQRPERSNNS
jgi:hypothetical protein